ncbi:MAG: hypothetical protein HFE86_05970, partial [Clostridiales bacterium]|nr:hypothetical protein [Clostridiales bacterium]
MIYITGDMHGEDARWYDRQLKRLRSGDTLLICGDFGYVWNGSKREKKDLEWLGSRPYSIGFLDGTHENFDLLNTYRQTVWNGGRVHRISGSLFHLIRGQIFTIEGLRFFVFGGGESPDKEIRLEQHSWWREELPSPAEMAEGAENLDEAGLQVDYILTHEPPSMVKSAVLLRSGHTDRVSKLNGYLEEIDRSCAFRHWYFGSIHEDRTITPKHTALFRKIIIAGEDLSNAEDNNFFRNMLGSFRTISRKAPAVKPSLEAKQEAKKKAEEAQKQLSAGQKLNAGQNTDASRAVGASPTTVAGQNTGASASTDAGASIAAGIGQVIAAGVGQGAAAGVGQGAAAGV